MLADAELALALGERSRERLRALVRARCLALLDRRVLVLREHLDK